MKPDPSWHPDPQLLVAFDSGALGEADSSIVEDHLGQCAECVARLLNGPEDSLVARLREVHAPPQGDTAVTSQADTSGCVAAPDGDLTAHWQSPNIVSHRNEIEPVTGSVARFTLLSQIGAGGFGIVYKAHDPNLDRHVAIKVPHEGILRTPSHRERFLREARSAATLSHPNICSVHEVGHWNDLPYIVMPVLEGETLAQWLDTGQRPSIAQAVRWVRSAAETLAYAHSKGVVHRDLKPSNILINERGEPILMDFGLAWRQSDQDTRLTGDLEIMGTPLYMSPEQTRGNAATTSPATDIYSLGVVLYELLTGRPPFQGALGELMGKILHVEPTPPSGLNPGVPPDLDAICMRCLAKDPAARFPSMDDLARALAACPTSPQSSSLNGKVGVNNLDVEVQRTRPAMEAVAPGLCEELPVAKTVIRRARPTWRTLTIATALAGLTIAAAIIVRMITDWGVIEIRSFDPNLDLTISIARNGDVEESAQLQHGQLTVKASSGDIEVRVDGANGSRFEIRNARFHLGRGQTQRVEIVQQTLENGPEKNSKEDLKKSPERVNANKSTADLLGQCLALGRSGGFSEVVQLASEAIRIDPQCAEAYEMRARASAELGDYTAAAADCDAALRLNPELVLAYVTSAQSNVALGRLDEAIRAANAGLERDANSIPCYANRGMARAKQSQLQEALADFSAIIERAPGDARGYWYRAAVYKLLGDREKSQKDADRARQLQPQLSQQQLPDFED